MLPHPEREAPDVRKLRQNLETELAEKRWRISRLDRYPQPMLNLGLNDDTVAGLETQSGNPQFAWDSYRRFVQMYGSVVDGLPKKANTAPSSASPLS